jgi:signal transduction histidine kinase
MATDVDEVVIHFEDTGRGLEAGTEEVIFQPTFTTKRNERGEDIGTGLGLTIVKSFVEVNTGGTITAKQRGELGGAVFIIRVPRSAKPDRQEYKK